MRSNHSFTRALALAGLISCVAPLPSSAHAAIVSVSGALVVGVPPAPADLNTDQTESDTIIRAFAERQNVTLASAVSVDISVAGSSPNGSGQNLSPSTIPAGTVVSSYLLHFDPVGTASPSIRLGGSITVDSSILGICVTHASMSATDPILGLPEVIYSVSGNKLELGGGSDGDSVTVDPTLRIVTVSFGCSSFNDEIRILTAASPIPEPGTLATLLLASSAAGLRRRR